MTVTTITLMGALALAALAVVYQVLRYVNGTLFPEIKALADNISELKTGHALNKQQTEQNTARLNGQSQKIDTILLAAPATPPVVPPSVSAYAAPSDASALPTQAAAPAEVIVPTKPPADINKSTVLDRDAVLTAIAALPATATAAIPSAGSAAGTEGD